MAALAPVAPGHVPGCAYDVVVEIMLQLDQLLIQGIFGCDPVAEPGPRDPDGLGPGHFQELFINDSAGKKQGRILCADAELLLHRFWIHPGQSFIKAVELLPGDPLERFSPVLVPEQVHDILSSSDDMLDPALLQVHLLVVGELAFHHFPDDPPGPLCGGAYVL